MSVTLLDLVSQLLDVLFLSVFSLFSLCVLVWLPFIDPLQVNLCFPQQREGCWSLQGILYLHYSIVNF